MCFVFHFAGSEVLVFHKDIKARNAAFLSEGISRQAEQLFSFMFDGVKLSQNHDVYIPSSAPFNTLTYRKTPC